MTKYAEKKLYFTLFSPPRLEVITLYAVKTSEQHQVVFKKTGENCRKVVLATNNVENSVTIPGMCHVIDSCSVKAGYG